RPRIPRVQLRNRARAPGSREGSWTRHGERGHTVTKKEEKTPMGRHEGGARVVLPGSPGAGTAALDQAWSVVAYGFLVSLMSSGVRFSIGPFLTPIMNDFHFTPSSLSGIVAASMLIYGFAMPFTGWLADTWSVRGVLTGGVLVMGASLLTIATPRSAEVFSFAFAVAASLGFAATSHVTLSPAVSRWFVR